MKTAVIGGGIAGLVTAWSLTKAGFEVTIFEKLGKTGFDAGNTVVCLEHEGVREIDVPLRLHNSSQWPRLLDLFRELGVESSEVDSSQSFSDQEGKSYFNVRHGGLFAMVPSILTRRAGRQIAADVWRFRDQGLKDLEQGIDSNLCFVDYLEAGGYSQEFALRFLYPILSSTVCTCSFEALSNYPAAILVEALAKITAIDEQAASFLYRSKYGSKRIVECLLSGETVVRTDCSVSSIHENDRGVVVEFRDQAENMVCQEEFEHAVVALQANHAARILNSDWSDLLSRFEYEDVDIFVHRDQRLMPQRRAEWATFNMLTSERAASCSIWLRKFYSDDRLPVDLFQTINPIFAPDKSTVIAHRKMQRPVVRNEYFALWDRIRSIQNQPGSESRIWVAGSYSRPGIPLLETGVISGLEVADSIARFRGDRLTPAR